MGKLLKGFKTYIFAAAGVAVEIGHEYIPDEFGPVGPILFGIAIWLSRRATKQAAAK